MKGEYRCSRFWYARIFSSYGKFKTANGRVFFLILIATTLISMNSLRQAGQSIPYAIMASINRHRPPSPDWTVSANCLENWIAHILVGALIFNFLPFTINGCNGIALGNSVFLLLPAFRCQPNKA